MLWSEFVQLFGTCEVVKRKSTHVNGASNNLQSRSPAVPGKRFAALPNAGDMWVRKIRIVVVGCRGGHASLRLAADKVYNVSSSL